jgi:hypothetical protein
MGVETQLLRITPVRGPPRWDSVDALMGEGLDVELYWDDVAQLAPDFEVDQRISW